MAERVWSIIRKKRWSPSQLLHHFGCIHPFVDIFGLARRLQIRVKVEEAPPWAGALRFGEGADAGADIWVRGEDTSARMRFTLAHEIGHLMLHPPSTYSDIAFYDLDNQTTEAEANRYAAGLLMPPAMLGRDLRRMSSLDVEALARRYVVPVHEMRGQLGRMLAGPS